MLARRVIPTIGYPRFAVRLSQVQPLGRLEIVGMYPCTLLDDIPRGLQGVKLEAIRIVSLR